MADSFALFKHGIFTINGASSTPPGVTGDAAIGINNSLIAVANYLDTAPGGKFVTAIGDGTAREFEITHNLASLNLDISVRLTASPYAELWTDAHATDENTVAIYFETPPTQDEYTVTIRG